jgi:hypothetical protein
MKKDITFDAGFKAQYMRALNGVASNVPCYMMRKRRNACSSTVGTVSGRNIFGLERVPLDVVASRAEAFDNERVRRQ